MARPFQFRKVLYLTEATGRRARSVDELLRLVTVAEPDVIDFHMHREFLAYKFAQPEYPNDFAYWTGRVIGDEVLGERLANLRVFKYRTLLEVQREIARILADHTLAHPSAGTVEAPVGREFHLCSARKFVLAAGREARDLDELMGGIAEIEASSLFYHLFETRYARGPESPHDFAAWVGDSLGRPKLAARLSSFDPYMFSMEQARRVLLRLLGEGSREEE